MLQKFLVHTTLWILFQLLIEINCQMTPFKPGVRNGHTATLLDNKLYILGGRDDAMIPISTNDFFYLDVSVQFNTQSLSWNNLSTIVPAHICKRWCE